MTLFRHLVYLIRVIRVVCSVREEAEDGRCS